MHSSILTWTCNTHQTTGVHAVCSMLCAPARAASWTRAACCMLHAAADQQSLCGSGLLLVGGLTIQHTVVDVTAAPWQVTLKLSLTCVLSACNMH